MALTATRSSFEKHLLATKPNKFLPKMNQFCGVLDDGLFKMGQHSANLAEEIYKRNHDMAGLERSRSVSSAFGHARDAISATRLVFPIYQLTTGQMFWETAKNEKGKLVWKKEGKNHFIRDPWKIAADVLVLFARLIAPVKWLHNLKVYDLGNHAAKGLGNASLGLWVSVCSIYLGKSINALITETQADKLKEQMWDSIQSGLDLVALPFDFGVGYHIPGVAIAGSVINIICAASTLAKEAAYYAE